LGKYLRVGSASRRNIRIDAIPPIEIIRQPPIEEKDGYDSKKPWISDGLPSTSRRRRRGDGKGEGGDWREK